jgi:tetratricopeptide (TPR) repeat protein
MTLDDLIKGFRERFSWVLRTTWVQTALLVMMTLVVYLPALRCGFVWDDDAYVTQNSTLLTTEGLLKIWADPAATPQYYPLVHTSFWVEQHLWGLHPLGYHLNNMLLHALAAVLVWRVLLRLALPGAWLAALVFAIHPVEVESVAWITERKNVLSGVFYLGSLLLFLRFAGIGPDNERKRWCDYALALALFIGALLSKTVVCTLPAVAVLLLWWKRGRLTRTETLALLPMFVLGLALGLTTVWLEKHHVGATGVDWQLSGVERCLVAGRVLWFYAAKLVWPQGLVFIYSHWEVDASAGWQYLFPLFALGVIACLWWRRVLLGRGPLVAVLCFAGTLLPALGFFDVYPMRYSYVADHFQYLAGLALIAPGVSLLFAAAQRWRWLVILPGMLVLALLGALTWSQCGQYRDIETLWRTTIKNNPDCWMAHQNLSTVLLQQGLAREAADHCEKALSLRGDNVESHVNLGNALLRMERIDDAILHFQSAEKLRPGSIEVLIDLGGSLLKKGRPDEAVSKFQQVLQLQPGLAVAHYSLGVAYSQKGQVDLALASYQRALVAQPDYVSAHYNLGIVLARGGRLYEAVEHFQKAVKLQPEFIEAHFNLGNNLLLLGRQAEAMIHFQRVLEANPDQIDTLNNLALLLATCPQASVRNGTTAVELAQRANRLSGSRNAVILQTQAAAYAEAGSFELAAETARRAANVAFDQGQLQLAETIQQERRLYLSGSPLRHVR